MIKAAQNALVLLGSTLLALLLAEVAVRFIMPQNLSGSWRVVDQSGLLMNKSSGKARQQLGNIVVHYSFGAWGSRRLAHAPPPGAQDKVLLVGDSFTFGWLIEDGKTYADALQQTWPNKRVVDAAAGGWGSADYTKYIALFCQKIHPRETYIFLNFDDIGRSVKSSLFTLDAKGELVETPPPPPAHSIKSALDGLPGYQWLIEHSHLAALVRMAFLTHAVLPPPPVTGAPPAARDSAVDEKQGAAGVALGKALFTKISHDSAACGTKTTVFYTGWSDLRTQADSKEVTARFAYEAKKTDFFKSIGLQFYDLSETKAMQAVYANRALYELAKDGHPNALGAQAIYRATIEALNGQGQNSQPSI